MDYFGSKPLFIFEMANNHMGNVEHGIRIIREFREICKGFDFNFSFKLQHRDVSFIHPDYRERKDMKYVKRFTETRLSKEHFKALKDEISKQGFISMCTPFDEKSVDLMEELGFNILKIASCSFTDWPLLERIARSNMPIVASTAGAALENIDRVVAFFEHRKKQFCLMHCIAAYPTKKEQLQLDQLDLFKKRYPSITIGYSTHESPDNYDAVQMAVAKGATVFEKHVGVPTNDIKLNNYSATPEQARQWLIAAKDALDMCGTPNARMEVSAQEKADLIPLFRGVFASRDLAKGEKIDASNTFYAIPNVEGQVFSRDMSKYNEFISTKDIKANQPVMHKDTTVKFLREKVQQIVDKLKAMIKKSKVAVPDQVDMEISAHYGIERFDEWGAVLIKVVNREYCKMLLVMFPGQNYPLHFHKQKEESLHILHGDLTIGFDGKEKDLQEGDVITVERGLKHSFKTRKGVVIEEISTTYFKGDSYYEDKEIATNKNRKVELTYWVKDRY